MHKTKSLYPSGSLYIFLVVIRNTLHSQYFVLYRISNAFHANTTCLFICFVSFFVFFFILIKIQSRFSSIQVFRFSTKNIRTSGSLIRKINFLSQLKLINLTYHRNHKRIQKYGKITNEGVWSDHVHSLFSKAYSPTF